jgi:hypothetical protein
VILKVLDQLKESVSLKAKPKVLSYIRKQIELGELHTKLLAMSMLLKWKEVSEDEKHSFTAQLLGLLDHAMLGVQVHALEMLTDMNVDVIESVKQNMFRKIMHKLDLLYNEESCDGLLKIKKIIPKAICAEKFNGMLEKLRNPPLLAGKSRAYIYRLFIKLIELVPDDMCVTLAAYMADEMQDQHFGADAALILGRLKNRLPVDLLATIAQAVFMQFSTVSELNGKHFKAVNEYMLFYSEAEKAIIFDKSLQFVKNFRQDEMASKAHATSHYDQLATCSMLLRQHFKNVSREKQRVILFDFLMRDSENPYEQLVFVDLYSQFKANFNRVLVQKMATDCVGSFPSDMLNEIMGHYAKMA